MGRQGKTAREEGKMRKRKMGDLDGLEKPKRAFWAIGASWDEMRLHYLNRLRKEGVRDRSGRRVGS